MVQIIGYIYKHNALKEHLLYTKILLLATHGVVQVVKNVFLFKRCLDILFRQHFTRFIEIFLEEKEKNLNSGETCIM